MAAKEGFKVGDKVVCPPHGVGVVMGLQQRSIGTLRAEILEILIEQSGLKLMVPMGQALIGALRKVASKREVENIYKILSSPRETKLDAQTWNKRLREYSAKIQHGSLVEIAEVMRDLKLLSGSKELSFGEKKMLNKAKALLVSEIAVSKARTEERIGLELDDLFKAA